MTSVSIVSRSDNTPEALRTVGGLMIKQIKYYFNTKVITFSNTPGFFFF